MKKFVLCLFLAYGTTAFPQPYGDWSWHDHDLVMTSASYNVVSPGHLMAGHYIAGVNQGKFKLFKVGQNTKPVIFDEQYEVSAGQLCAPTPPVVPAEGVSAIEVAAGGPGAYAASGVVPDGCFFATFNASGVLNLMKYFYFPPGANFPSQTTLLEIPGGLGGGFLITGSFILPSTGRRLLYIIQLDNLGNFVQTLSYHMNPSTFPSCSNFGYDLKPFSMILSPTSITPSGQTEIIIVGEATPYPGAFCPGPPLQINGFFMRVDLATLGFLSANLYGQGLASPATDFFKSVTPATFQSTDSYLIGGFSDSQSLTNTRAWMLMVDQSGNLHWNYLYNSSLGDAREVMQVVHRSNSLYGPINYGAVLSQSAGMLCFKLDEYGIPFTSTLPVDNLNEFNYQSGPTNAPFPDYQTSNMSIEQNSGSSEGIHVYGTAGTVMNWYMVKASFNGVSGFTGKCSTNVFNNLLATLPGPPSIVPAPFVNVFPAESPIPCTNINITQTSFVTVPNPICFGVASPHHSNNRTISSIVENAEGSLVVSPNPTHSEIKVEFPSTTVLSSIRMLDLSGRVVAIIPIERNNGNEVIYDFGDKNIPNGIYFIEAETPSGKLLTKLMVQH